MKCGIYNPNAYCQCLPSCWRYHDCCFDFSRTCRAASPAGSCSQYECGPYRHDQECQCNAQCEKYGNCCKDYAQHCSVSPAPAPVSPAPAPVSPSNVVVGYHQTSPDIGPLILAQGFKR